MIKILILESCLHFDQIVKLIPTDKKIHLFSECGKAFTCANYHERSLTGEKPDEGIQYGEAFKGSLNPNTCLLGTWNSSLTDEDLSDQVISSTLNNIKSPHEKMHTLAAEILQIEDKDTAHQRYINDIKPHYLILNSS